MVASIRDEIQTRLNTISGLRAFDVVKGRIVSPSAFVRPTGASQVTKDDQRDFRFTIDVYVSVNSLRAAQDKMDGYWPGGDNDIQAAVEADQSLNSTVGWVTCDVLDNTYDLVTYGTPPDERPYLTCQWTVEVGA
jgi:hypothetical protein